MKYENTFKAIDQILWKEQGCGSELDYLEQKSWMLFLKYLDDLETESEEEAELDGKTYKRLVTGFYRWSQWATPKKKDPETGRMVLDTVNAMSGDDLVEFVDQKLFPYLKEFQNTATQTDSLEYKIGEIFGELHNKIRSGFNMREIINMIDELHFQSAEDKHEMTVLYESNIQRMGNAGRNGGEYYTPRPLIRSIIKVVDPHIGETVYDPACGSAGFLCEAFLYMKDKINSVKDHEILQKETFYGKEKKGLPYIIATMNMIFHGVSAPNISHGNTLAMNLSQIQESDRKNVILANPPFGGNERGEVLQNFEIRTSETAYMFMQHFIKMLKAGGRAGVVIKNTFLSNNDASAIRKMLLENCNLHTILDLPNGVFTGAGVKTVVLFFTKGEPTEKIWYYQVDKHFTKTHPLTEADMEEFLTLQKTQGESEHSWTIDATKLNETCDLSVNNPNKVEVVDERTPKEIFDILKEKQSEVKDALDSFLLGQDSEEGGNRKEWIHEKLGDACNINYGTRVVRSRDAGTVYPVYGGGGATFNMDTYNREDCMVISRFGMSEECTRFVKGKFFLNDSGLTLSLKDSCMIQDFLDWQIYSLNKKIYALGRGAAQKNLDTKALAEITLSYPSDITEQQSIVEKLESAFTQIDELRENLEKQLKECDALKQAILRKVFK